MTFTPNYGSIVGRWDFDSVLDVLADESALGNDAILNGATATPGALSFDGVDDHLVIPHDAAYALSEATIIFTGTLAGLPSGGGRWGLFSKDSTNFDDGGHLTAWVLANGAIEIRMQSDTGNTVLVTDPGTVQPGVEFTLVTTLDPDTGTVQIAVDGVELASAAAPLMLDQNAEPWVLGADQTTSGDGVADVVKNFMQGEISLFQIMDTALTGAEVEAYLAPDASLPTVIPDTILLDAVPGQGDTLTLNTGISGLGPALSFAGTNGAGEPLYEVAGETLTLTDVSVGSFTITQASGAATPVSAAVITLTDPATGSTQTLLLVQDSDGDLPGITQISVDTFPEPNPIGTDLLPYFGGDQLLSITAPGGGLHDLTDGSDQGAINGTGGADVIWGGAADGLADGGAQIDDTITARGGDDTVFAGDGDDVVSAGGGNDLVDAGTGDDFVRGQAGNDTVDGGAGNDTLQGDGGADSLTGGAGADLIRGGVGSDTLVGNDDAAGAVGDSLFGDTGSDLFLANGGDVVTGGEDGNGLDIDRLHVENIAGIQFTGTQTEAETESGTITFADGTELSFAQIEEIYVDGALYVPTVHDLTDGSDQGVITGTFAADEIWGGPGAGQADGGAVIDDMITGGGGADTILAGDGADTVQGGTGDDSIAGGTGDDALSGQAGADTLLGGAGDDTLGVGAVPAPVNLLQNGSFEDGTHGVGGVGGLDNWAVTLGTPDASDDLNAASEWNTANTGTDGTAYVSLVTRPDGTFEAMQQTLDTPLTTGGAYTFSMNALSAQQVGSTFFTPSDIPVTFQLLDGATGTVLGETTVQGASYAPYEISFTAPAPVSTFVLQVQSAGVGTYASVVLDEVALVEVALEEGDDLLDGGAGDDLLDGGVGADTLIGGTGNDTIIGGAGDVVDGSEDPDDSDFDQLFADNVAGISFTGPPGDFETGTLTFDGGGTLDFANIEALTLDGSLLAPEPPSVFDLIQLQGALPATGQPQSTAAGDLIAVDDGLSVTAQATSGVLSVGDTLLIGGQGATVTSTASFTADVVHDDIYGIPTTSSVAGQSITVTPDGGGAPITYVLPFDAAGPLPEIQQITLTSTDANDAPVPLALLSDADVGEDDVVTLAGAEASQTIPFDLIAVSGFDATTSGAALTGAAGPNGTLQGVADALPVTLSNPAQLQVGDTAEIGGVSWTLTGITTGGTATISHADPAGGGPTATPGVPVAALTFSDGAGGTLSYLVPLDSAGDLPQITAIDYTAPFLPTAPVVPLAQIDSNDIVTLATGQSAPIHDAVLSMGPAPLPGATLVSGVELLSVEDPLVFDTAPGGGVGPGATVTIGGTLYQVTASTLASVTVTEADGATTSTTAAVLTAQDATGQQITLTLPQDAAGDLPDIVAISYDALTPSDAVTLPEGLVDSDDTVELATLPLIRDLIEISSLTAPTSGDVLTAGNGTGGAPDDLAGVTEAVGILTQATPGVLSLGDTLAIDGTLYTVQALDTVTLDVTYDGGAQTATGVTGTTLTLAGPDGAPLIYTLPDDGAALPDITAISYTAVTPGATSIPVPSVDDDDAVSLAPPGSGAADPVVVHDLVALSGVPAQGDSFTSAGLTGGPGDGVLTQIIEPLVFDTATPEAISPGDTVSLGGVPFTVTATDQWTGTVAHGDPATGAPTTSTVSGALITAQNGAETITWAVPFDAFGALPDITEITFDTLDTTPDPAIDTDTVDGNEFTTLICFARGTRIITPLGEIAVEDLATDDLVLTKDNGFQPIRWIGATRVAAEGDLAPIHFQTGALGNTRPLRVSPQHRMALTDWRAEMLFGSSECLVAAKHLVNGDTITRAPGGEVEYFHLLFDRHELIFAEGIPSESFHPGVGGINGLEAETRAELLHLFPELAVHPAGFGASARPSLKAYEVAVLQGAF